MGLEEIGDLDDRYSEFFEPVPPAGCTSHSRAYKNGIGSQMDDRFQIQGVHFADFRNTSVPDPFADPGVEGIGCVVNRADGIGGIKNGEVGQESGGQQCNPG